MFAPSAKRAPSAPVLPALSEPAKSIRLILLISSLSGFPSGVKYFYLKIIIDTVCALDDVAFMLVEPIVLFSVPISI